MIYESAEDSELMLETLKKNLKNKNLKILEVGVGSGFILENLRDEGFKNSTGVDVNPDAIKLCSEKNLNVKYSDLFSNINGKFDIIFFNPPYLPKDNEEDAESSVATTGGKTGSEVINRFLINAHKHLDKNGEIFLLISSLTKEINWFNYKKSLVGEKKLFFENLEVWRLQIKKL